MASILKVTEITTPDGTGNITVSRPLTGGTGVKGGDIASASPLVIDTDGDYFDVTGTTNFAAMTVAADRQFTLQFDGALTMTHHATNLDLPGEANITTAAGDVAIFQSTGANTVQCVSYVKADGTAVVGSVEGTAVLSTGEAGGTKYLREDGDGTSSWQAAGAGTAILGSTANNTLRVALFVISTEGGATITVGYDSTGGQSFNSSGQIDNTTSASISKSGSDTVGSGATEVTYSLDGDGASITINMVETATQIISSNVIWNDTALAIENNAKITSGNLVANFRNPESAATVDFSAVGAGKSVYFILVYLAGGSA